MNGQRIDLAPYNIYGVNKGSEDSGRTREEIVRELDKKRQEEIEKFIESSKNSNDDKYLNYAKDLQTRFESVLSGGSWSKNENINKNFDINSIIGTKPDFKQYNPSNNISVEKISRYLADPRDGLAGFKRPPNKYTSTMANDLWNLIDPENKEDKLKLLTDLFGTFAQVAEVSEQFNKFRGYIEQSQAGDGNFFGLVMQGSDKHINNLHDEVTTGWNPWEDDSEQNSWRNIKDSISKEVRQYRSGGGYWAFKRANLYMGDSNSDINDDTEETGLNPDQKLKAGIRFILDWNREVRATRTNSNGEIVGANQRFNDAKPKEQNSFLKKFAGYFTNLGKTWLNNVQGIGKSYGSNIDPDIAKRGVRLLSSNSSINIGSMVDPMYRRQSDGRSGMYNISMNYLFQSGADFLKHMFDAMIVFQKSETQLDFFEDIKLKLKNDFKIDFSNYLRGLDSSSFMVRLSSIDIPQPVSEVFELKTPLHTVTKIQSKVSFERKASFKMRLDEPLFYLDLFNIISNNNTLIFDTKSIGTSLPPLFYPNDLVFSNNIFTKNKINLIVNQKLLNSETFSWFDDMEDHGGKTYPNLFRSLATRMSSATDTSTDSSKITPQVRATILGPAEDETTSWLFEDIKFIGEGDDLSYKRDGVSTQDMTFNFVFKRLVKIDRTRHDGTPDSYSSKISSASANLDWVSALDSSLNKPQET